ncbi:MAG: phosphoenolpyruvate--protein phosphotransferase [Clostridia bacterium]|nr:phosphoenolpyruvate--protein phosphotransferase [Clostridia bacterium]
MGEYTLAGQPISKGIGIGEIFVYEEHGLELNRGNVQEDQLLNEIEKLEKAIAKTLYEIDDLKASFSKRLEKDEWFIFDAFRSMLQDEYFIEEIKDIIHHERYYAENAVDCCIGGYIKAIESSGNEYAMQSIYDMNDINARIIRNIIGDDQSKVMLDKISKKHVVGVRHLNLTLAATLGKRKISGIIYEAGAGYLSHAAIILRGLGIPAVSGIKFEDVKKIEGASVILDAEQGHIIINPVDTQVGEYKDLHKGGARRSSRLLFRRNKPTCTSDGYKVNISASVGSFEECESAGLKNVAGIGLVRTEMLFAHYKNFPDEQEQYAAYLRITKKMGHRPVMIRTADIGGDKQFDFLGSVDSSAVRSTRGIKYTLTNKEMFHTQIKSILRAGSGGNIAISFPMVDTAEEIREAKKVISRSMQKLLDEGTPVKKKLKIGAFIETRQGVDHLESILHEVDYVTIGTNDLLHQMMGIDRKKAASLRGEYLHPKFLRVLKYCIDKARKNNKPLNICGEIASDPTALMLMLGMGAVSFIVNPSKVEEVNDLVKSLNYRKIKELAEKALICKAIDEVKDLVIRFGR